jgi:serine protease
MSPRQPGTRVAACARRVRAALALCALVGATTLAPAQSAEGLIVRLKDAPAHGDLARDRARAERETTRWRALLADTALSGASGQREPARRAVGRDQQLLDFGRTLDAREAATLAERLRRRPEVDWVAPNVRERRLQVPSDPLYARQWWLFPVAGSNANALDDRRRGVPGFQAAWASGIPGALGEDAGVVAVLDTGITAHPDLVGRILPGRDFVSDPLFANDGNGRDADPSDPGDWVDATDLANPRFVSAGCVATPSSWHGTIIAGQLAALADNGEGVAGIARAGRVLPVRVAGKCGATVADIVDGMRWAAGLPVDGHTNPYPARILNVSFGGSLDCGPEYQGTIDELRAQGVVVVAAAGNEHGRVTRPASCNGVVGVAALNRDGFKASYSNFGAVLSATGIATVGGDDTSEGLWRELADGGLVTLRNAGTKAPGAADYAALYGTSFAAPLVSGTLSLMLSVNPTLSADQLIAGLRASARPHVGSALIPACSDTHPGRCICSTATCGAGILDAGQALVYAQAPASYSAPVWPLQSIGYDPDGLLANALARGPDRAPNLPGTTEPAPPAPPSVESDGGGGGGALGAGWLALLALAVAALRRR